MGLDMAKYRRIFLEEAVDHLAEISRALLQLEKEMANSDAIDTIFRMAHSIKSMAASLGYDPISELSHRLEDRMEGLRTDGRVRGHEELSLLFQTLEVLEAMVAAVSDDVALPAAPESLIIALAGPVNEGASASPETPPEVAPPAVGGEPKKVRI